MVGQNYLDIFLPKNEHQPLNLSKNDFHLKDIVQENMFWLWH